MRIHSGKMGVDIRPLPVVTLFLALGAILFSPPVDAGTEGGETASKSWRILHIMSYHSPWKWTDDQLNGFKEAMKGLNVEYKIFQMDAKRKRAAEELVEAGRAARDLIEAWKPDLVYTSDDYAQEYVTKYYLDSTIPFVFSGVNKEPSQYGFPGSGNVAGVLEKSHFIQSVLLLKEIAPNVRKIGVIVDSGATWPGVVRTMRRELRQAPDVEEIELSSLDVIHTFEEYKQTILDYHGRVDAVALLGIFSYKDEKGEPAPYRDVLRWTAENSRLPDFSFWKDRIYHGTLCTVTVSGYEQGFSAGRIARGILAEGKRPADFPMEPTIKGEPVISLARANRLGIPIKTRLLLSTEVITQFSWEQ